MPDWQPIVSTYLARFPTITSADVDRTEHWASNASMFSATGSWRAKVVRGELFVKFIRAHSHWAERASVLRIVVLALDGLRLCVRSRGLRRGEPHAAGWRRRRLLVCSQLFARKLAALDRLRLARRRRRLGCRLRCSYLFGSRRIVSLFQSPFWCKLLPACLFDLYHL